MNSDSTSQVNAQDNADLPSGGSTTGESKGLWSSAIRLLNTPASAPPAERIKGVRIRSTIFLVVMLVVLFWRAQAETARTEVLLVFLAYIIAAVLWVRAQYVDALDGNALVPPRGLTWALTAVGAGAAVLGFALVFTDDPPVPPSSLLIPGALATYFGVGHLISRSRSFIARPEAQPEVGSDAAGLSWWRRLIQHARRFGARLRSSWKWLLGLLAFLVGLVCLGLALLGEAPMWVSLILIAGLAFIPWLLSLLSEHAINHFTRDESRVRAITMVGGFLIALGLLAWVGAQWGRLPAMAAAALLALVVALASFTLADIAAVLAIIAFMGITPAQDRPDRPIEVKNARSVLVAFGDSYMSGEGASTFIQGTDEGDGNECRRARTTWSMIAGGHSPFTGVVSFACSGADSPNIRREPTDKDEPTDGGGDAGFLEPRPFPQFPGERTQLDDYDAWAATMGKDFKPSLVVLSIGGNDAGFSSIGLTCVVPGSCNQDEPKELWENLDRVDNRLRQVYDEVADAFPDTPVAVIPYPDPIHESARVSQCESTFLVPGDAQFVAGFLGRLNARIRETSGDFGFHYVSTMVDALKERNLQLCDEVNRGRAGVNFIGLRSVGGLSEQRFNPTKWHHNSLHPNERGHAALHAAFLEWLNDPEVGGPEALSPPHPRGQRGTAPRSEESPGGGDCTTYAVGDKTNGCRAQSNAWAFGEAGEFALKAGGIATLILMCGWASAVAFFGWRRSKAKTSPLPPDRAFRGGSRPRPRR